MDSKPSARRRFWIVPACRTFRFIRRIGHDQCGLVMATLDCSEEFRKKVKKQFGHWEYAAFVANSLIFLLIGMHEAHQDFAAVWLAALTAIWLVALGAAFSFSRSSLPVMLKHQHVSFLGRNARRRCPCTGPRTSASVSAARDDRNHQLCRDSLFGFRPWFSHDFCFAPGGRDSSGLGR